jgi:hypothetical protein
MQSSQPPSCIQVTPRCDGGVDTIPKRIDECLFRTKKKDQEVVEMAGVSKQWMAAAISALASCSDVVRQTVNVRIRTVPIM